MPHKLAPLNANNQLQYYCNNICLSRHFEAFGPKKKKEQQSQPYSIIVFSKPASQSASRAASQGFLAHFYWQWRREASAIYERELPQSLLIDVLHVRVAQKCLLPCIPETLVLASTLAKLFFMMYMQFIAPFARGIHCPTDAPGNSPWRGLK